MDVRFLYNPECGHCRHALETVRAGLEDVPEADLEVVDLGEDPEVAEEYDLQCCPGVVVEDRLAYLGVPSGEDLRRRLRETGEDDEPPEFARRYENSTPAGDRAEI